jgi:hypothetical protein
MLTAPDRGFEPAAGPAKIEIAPGGNP